MKIRTRKRFIALAAPVVVSIGLTLDTANTANASTSDDSRALSSAIMATVAADGQSGPQQVTPQTPADCVYYLRLAGYTITAKRVDACNSATTPIGGYAFCVGGLVDYGVTRYHADNACRLGLD
ncbi:hypothetical protein [Amycolatopsis anabasis]|uniref:hypothetical protein n=1 Tax=Amycolatopsis anabasis TaxID=1840409 RepID=UPI00131E1950|nr:hypothetical protein [Amycolatopsis anabasis]